MHASSTWTVCIPLFEESVYLKKSVPLLVHFSLQVHVKQRGDNIYALCVCACVHAHVIREKYGEVSFQHGDLLIIPLVCTLY
jgi:hypothetical protein